MPATPEPHIQVLWRVKYVTLSFTLTTLEHRKVLTFAWGIRLGKLPATVEVLTGWLDVINVVAPSKEELTQSLSAKVLRTVPNGNDRNI